MSDNGAAGGGLPSPKMGAWRQYVVAFDSTHAAMAAASVLEARGARVMPTPRVISASCGMSLRFGAPSDIAAQAFAASDTDLGGMAALYAQEGDQYRLVRQL